MNTTNLKSYAPKARTQFIAAIKKRAAQFGLYEDKIADVHFEGSAAIIEGRAFTKKQGQQRKRLEQRIASKPLDTHNERYELFVREMAYTWFNRLAAIRYMELHDYLEHGFRVLSHPNNPDALPEILDHASDVADFLALDKSHIIELQLAGDKEEELYRQLLLGQCHYLAKIMPSIFAENGFTGIAGETIDDATELLLPDNLTKTDSILKGLVNGIPEEDWQEIEVIGWLYQFYISEYKDTVMGKVVKSEDIPAATQLFTPNWIVKYLVQNSLGRQWLATYPNSKIKEKMEYYIEPAEQSEEVIQQLKAITPTSIDPEKIKVLDPAAGSGHILVEVYEVLREIYLERGYRLREIPELILTKNIYGLDIDDRAAQLASFALMMKAREDDRRIFQRVQDGDVALNIYSLQSTESLDVPKLWDALDLEDKQQKGTTGGLFDEIDRRDKFEYRDNFNPVETVISDQTSIYSKYYQLFELLTPAFSLAKTLGSLIQIDNQHLSNLVVLKDLLAAKQKSSDPAAKQASNEILPIIKQSILLAQQYDVVVANPPYMGGKGMNAVLSNFAKKHFPNSKSDLFAIFIERGFKWLGKEGFNAMVTMQSWMFLSSYEQMRKSILDKYIIENMVHMGNGVMKIAFGTNATVFRNSHLDSFKGQFSYCRNDDINKLGVPLEFPIKNERLKTAASKDFRNIPGSPVAYWASDAVQNAFKKNINLAQIASIGKGLDTGANERFLRLWHEVSKNSNKWVPCQKGGPFRKWYGNNDYVINWGQDGAELKLFKGSNLRNAHNYFKSGLSWTRISSGNTAFRRFPKGQIFESTGPCIFPTDGNDTKFISGLLNSKVTAHFFEYIAPTMDFQSGHVSLIPVTSSKSKSKITDIVNEIENIHKKDWDSHEISSDFKLDQFTDSKESIKENYFIMSNYWNAKVGRCVELETNLNEVLICEYGLVNELDSEIPIERITLFNNPYYTFTNSSKAILLNQSSFCQRILSNYVGLVMGRYSLDREGLFYANSGNHGFKELVSKISYQTFPADDDGIIPLASENWLYEDDATTRFREFVGTVWGENHIQDNLEFVAESLCLHALKSKKGEGAMDTIRRYFSIQFFKDHCKTYKKRPIYWLFSSGKEKAFECLVYLHRYNEGTLSRMRTEYVTPLMGKYDAQHSLLSEQVLGATGTELRTIEKDLKALSKKQAELRTFDEQLKHYADMRISLDLDDGVKVNYGKFGNLLADVKNIHGVAVK